MELPIPATARADEPADARGIYLQHGEFVWKSLARLGVRDPDLRDMTQEVFLVVHRRLGEREGTSSLTTWLFGICVKVAAGYRRRAFRRREELVDAVPDAADDAGESAASPEEAAVARQARARLAAILDELELEQRAVFVMFEIDQMPCHEIAAVTGAPLGTVYSRLRAARKAFEAALKRCAARESWEESR